jgi:16S rRNA processing protein RimM
VAGAHGIRGLLRVHSYNPDSEQLEVDGTVTLEHGSASGHYRIESVTRHGRGLLVALEGVTDRSGAERLRGARLLVDRTALPVLAAGEFYHHEVLGAEVVAEDGRPVGTITRTMSTGLNDVWIVRDATGEHLIPVIADVVVDIDLGARRIVIRDVPGLLD